MARERPTGEASTFEALVLRTVPYGESDLVVHLLARGRGRVGAFARGGRRSSRRYGGALESFALVQAEVQERRGSELAELRSATIVEPFLGLRGDLGRLAHAGYGVELARELTREKQPNDALLDLLLAFLGGLVVTGPRSLRLRALELGALDTAGVAPQLDACARCGRALDDGQPLAFGPLLGGAGCRSCAGNGALALDLGTLALLRALQRGGVAATEVAADEGLPLAATHRLLRHFVDHYVRKGLKSLDFLHDVGAPP
jgi:DNA repair protein RecO (recombination protein O)